jgi:predicted MFS family arabinose efflux permease
VNVPKTHDNHLVVDFLDGYLTVSDLCSEYSQLDDIFSGALGLKTAGVTSTRTLSRSTLFGILQQCQTISTAAVDQATGGTYACRTVEAYAALARVTVFVTSTLCTPLLTFSPILVRDAFAGNVAHFSGVVTAFGLGGLVAAGLLAVDARSDRRPIAARFSLAFAAIVVLVALNPWAWGLPVLFTLAGLAMTAGNVSVNAFIQIAAPPSLRGRSISLYMLAMRGGLSIGGLLTGLSMNWLGVRHALLLNGVLALALQAANAHGWLQHRPAANPLPEESRA